MSDFDYQPLNGATPSVQPRVLQAVYGDGYEQRVADGVNNQKQVWSNLTFRDTASNINTIYDFLVAKGGVDSFTWTPSGFSEITVVCRAWSRPVVNRNIGEISCTFEQVFGE